MSLDEIRMKLDGIDTELSSLFCRRMALSEEIAAIKAGSGMQVHLPQREQQVVERLLAINGAAYGDELKALYQTIFSLSRARQERLIQAFSEKTPPV